MLLTFVYAKTFAIEVSPQGHFNNTMKVGKPERPYCNSFKEMLS